MTKPSAERFERIVMAMPSLSEAERATAIALGVGAFVAFGKAVDENDGPANAVTVPGGLRPATAMTLASIAEGRDGPWREIQ